MGKRREWTDTVDKAHPAHVRRKVEDPVAPARSTLTVLELPEVELKELRAELLPLEIDVLRSRLPKRECCGHPWRVVSNIDEENEENDGRAAEKGTMFFLLLVVEGRAQSATQGCDCRQTSISIALQSILREDHLLDVCHHDVMALFKKPFGEMGTDKARAACH